MAKKPNFLSLKEKNQIIQMLLNFKKQGYKFKTMAEAAKYVEQQFGFPCTTSNVRRTIIDGELEITDHIDAASGTANSRKIEDLKQEIEDLRDRVQHLENELLEPPESEPPQAPPFGS